MTSSCPRTGCGRRWPTTSGPALSHELDRLLGSAWDDELEPYRHAGAGTSVTWLHQVV